MDMYKKAKIYSIRSYQTDEIYIGSTCDTLYKRLRGHRSKYKQYLNNKHHFVTSYHILKYNDHYIELIEEYPCHSKMQLLKREGEIIRETANCVNRCIAGRTGSEYRKENHVKLYEQQKEYYNKNKEKIAEKCKEYYNKNKDKLNEKNKEWREDNREKLIEYKKEYYNENKETIAEKGKERFTCNICNCEIRKSDIARHNKTKKHIKHINIEEEQENIQ